VGAFATVSHRTNVKGILYYLIIFFQIKYVLKFFKTKNLFCAFLQSYLIKKGTEQKGTNIFDYPSNDLCRKVFLFHYKFNSIQKSISI